ncbi:RNA polymerase sigma-70 factor [Mariniphaga sediminis]|uniref:RNA polymerase sigma factor n=1 Tax=Mariniphaga sediminis TaxID=1628158 RepID=A0A399D1G0_9BACT|nr:RNA polymerase sigma-70 factor [Mariniphaga sediminis]RIH64200.1 RNA polymerase sigma-70 factor [Mariniphaga sediminis]RIH66479.1 RNA polymerase sigma-70 factor [Mariniphaga sediminis]
MAEQSKYDNNQLTERIKSDDIGAFKSLYDLYSRQLLNFILQYLKETGEAEEILQDVFLSVWESRKSLQVDKSVKSYLFRIAVNKVYNHLKRRVVERKYQYYLSNNEHTSENNIEDKIYFSELKETIDQILGQLPVQQRRIFRLSRLEGMSHDEIAKKFNISVRTVENQIYRAGKFVKSKLNGDSLILFFIVYTTVKQ